MGTGETKNRHGKKMVTRKSGKQEWRKVARSGVEEWGEGVC